MTKTFLPQISNAPTITLSGASAFAVVWLKALGERGKVMVYDALLAAAAQRQANWLAVHDFNPTGPHLGENNSTPNIRVREAGYKLPTWHGNGNTVESATRSWDEIDETVADLMAHPTHREHMNCLGFWEPNYWYGTGAAGGFYVVVTAPPEG